MMLIAPQLDPVIAFVLLLVFVSVLLGGLVIAWAFASQSGSERNRPLPALEDPSDAERAREYVMQGGTNCPRCGSNKLKEYELAVQPLPGLISRGLVCARCGTLLVEVYQLAYVKIQGEEQDDQHHD